MRNELFIINPNANGGRLLENWERLKQQIPVLQQAHQIVTPDLNAMRQAVSDAPEGTRVVVVGGDGSLHQLVNQAVERDVLGLVPLGTGSDACRSLDLPVNARKAVERVIAGDVTQADVLQCQLDGKPVKCVNVLSLGYSGQVAQRVNALPAKQAWSYLEQGVKALFDRREQKVRVTSNDKVIFEGDVLLMALANGAYFGKGMHIAPKANPHNGMLDMVAVRNAAIPFILPHIPLLYLGWHPISPIVTMTKAKHVLVESLSGPLPLELDGETYSAERIEVGVQANAVRL